MANTITPTSRAVYTNRISIVPFRAEHIGELGSYGGQERLVMHASRFDLESIAKRGIAYSGLIDNRVVACAGLLEANRYRATAWALFSTESGANFLTIHRVVKKGLDESSYKIIEAYVDPKFIVATRWIKLLGFQLRRAYLPYFFPDGSGASEWIYWKE